MTLIQPPSMTLNRQQLVSLLDVKESAFDHARAKLEDNHFPKRLPGILRWSRPAVIAWIKASGNLDMMNRILIGDPQEQEDQDLPIPDIAADLAARYGGIEA